MNPDKMGCDLRPANPEKIDLESISCCGAEAPTETVTAGANGHANGTVREWRRLTKRGPRTLQERKVATAPYTALQA